MRNVRYIAMLLALTFVSACSNGSNDFYNAYSSVELGGVGPIPLDD